MRVLLAILLVSVAVVSATTSDAEYESLFTKYVAQFGKQYHHNDFFSRFHIFKKNIDTINAHNAQGNTWTMGVNQFTDMTPAEFSSFTGYKSVRRDFARSRNLANLDDVVLAASIDWSAKGAVTPIKNQGQCGSCWSFSATGSMEGAWFIAKGALVSLSEQELVDCSGSFGNEGCSGGLMDYAFEYVITEKRLATEAAYPYTAADGTCQSSTIAKSGVTISKYQDVASGNETALLAAANIGPVSVAIEADQSVFQFYSGGVLDSTACGTSLDHGVLVVGYGTDGGVNYWKVKNSWGASWGEAGYIRMIRDKDMCGIATDPSYPIVA